VADDKKDKKEPFHRIYGDWNGPTNVHGSPFVCGNCGADAAPHAGFRNSVSQAIIAICPRCHHPTMIIEGRIQIPGAPMGRPVDELPENVERFYSEARRCGTVDAWDAVALLCRTLLMHVAVDKKVAKLGDYFEACVDALDNGGWITVGGKPWVDSVRKIGNKAAHKADPVTKDEAAMILGFVELLLRTGYEAPAKFAASVAK
jgi:hypothetical protein